MLRVLRFGLSGHRNGDGIRLIVQTSGILTTAYEAENGYVYVYFFDNYTPGKLRILADKPGQTAPRFLLPDHD